MKAETAVDRVVFDTNVLISAALSAHATPARLLQAMLPHGQPLFSHESFSELETRLWKPKFDRYISIDDRNALLRDLSAAALWVELPPPPRTAFCRDPDDDLIIHTALAGGAPWLISGDADLLEMPTIPSLEVLSPFDALRRWSRII